MFGTAYNRGLFAADYRPSKAEIAAKPTPGKFYQTKKGDSVWVIAKKAYSTPKPGIFWINDSEWNSHIRKGKPGWTAYKIKGLQITAHYDPSRAPSPYGSGKAYPLLWIPATAGDEPEALPLPGPPPAAKECPPCEPRIIEKRVEVPVPGPERVVEVRVPGPERVVEVKVPGPERVVEVQIPGPERIVEKRVEVPVPGPERVVEVPVPGPPRIVEKRVEVPVPGPERVVEVPVPGPPRIIEKRVEVPVPGPERVVEVRVPGKGGREWTTLQSVGFWSAVIAGLARMGD